jgi:hypothetical protein
MRTTGGSNHPSEPASEDAPEGHRALAFELAHILQNWPNDVPAERRETLALQLENIVLLLDRPTRQDLAIRLGQDASTPLALSAILFFDAPRCVRDAILARHAHGAPEPDCEPTADDGLALILAARDYSATSFAPALARTTGIPPFAANRVLSDVSGECLAILCRGANLPRLVFSTIAVLADASLAAAERKLELFDAVADAPARGLVRSWRAARRWQRNGLAETPLPAPARHTSA